MQASLGAAGIDPNTATLFLSECVLVYLEPEESCALIAWAARAFPRSVFATYEQIRPHDSFGQVMARNLAERGYSLRGLAAFPDPAAQVNKNA
jgi:O-methyltransferase involved in polyketide biosynthesis